MSVSRFGVIGVAGAVYFAATGVVLHFIKSDIDPLQITISEYALGQFGWLMTAAFLVVGVGTLSLALGLRRSLAPGKRVATSVVLMALAGLGFIVSGIFEADPDAEASIHDLAGLLLFLAVIIGAFVLRGVFARDARWQGLAGPARWFAFGLLATFLLFFFLSEQVTGLAQRVFVAVMMTWLAVIGWWMRRPPYGRLEQRQSPR